MNRPVGYILLFWLALLPLVGVLAQSKDPKIKQLEKQRSELKKQIAESESMLLSTSKDVKSQLSNLALLSGQITERQRYIWKIENDIRTIQLDINRMTIELRQMEKDLKDKQEKYALSMKHIHRNRSIQEKLMFIFSGENLEQIYRRLRYVKEYAGYQRLQGEQLKTKHKLVDEQRKSLVANQNEKKKLRQLGEVQRTELLGKEKERKTLLDKLQKRQREIRKELAKNRKSADDLNKEIDRLVEIEIEKARKRAAEEAKRKAAAQARAKAKAEADTKSETSSQQSSSTPRPTRPSGKVEVYKIDSADRALSSSFVKNKGKLPVPITGSYLIVGHYGQYQVKGLKGVLLDNKGMDIKGKKGACARAIFNGEVSAIFQHNGLTNILVRHGSYISVYCNLSSVKVKKGSHVQTKDVLGEVHTDSDGNTILHFQLRKETVKLNPEAWIFR